MGGPEVVGGRYALLDPAPWPGPTGTAWSAQDPDGRELTVLLVHDAVAAEPFFAERLETARWLLPRVRGEHVLAVRDVVADRGALALVLDRADVLDLPAHVALTGGLGPASACALAADVADALAAAHAAGVLHLRLAPECVLLDAVASGARARLAGAGIVSLLEGQGWSPPAPPHGAPWTRWAAPEVLAGLAGLGVGLGVGADARPVTAAADLHSLGAVLRHLLGAAALAAAPAALRGLLDELLAADPAARPGDASEVAARLRHLAGAVPLRRPGAPALPDHPPTARTRQLAPPGVVVGDLLRAARAEVLPARRAGGAAAAGGGWSSVVEGAGDVVEGPPGRRLLRPGARHRAQRPSRAPQGPRARAGRPVVTGVVAGALLLTGTGAAARGGDGAPTTAPAHDLTSGLVATTTQPGARATSTGTVATSTATTASTASTASTTAGPSTGPAAGPQAPDGPPAEATGPVHAAGPRLGRR